MNKDILEIFIKEVKDTKITKPLDSYVDYDTTVGEYYEDEFEDLLKDSEIIELIKKNKRIFKEAIWGYKHAMYGQSMSECERHARVSAELDKIDQWLDEEY